jgi:hypothetical protein
VDAAGWMVTVRLAGKGAGPRRDVAAEGLQGATHLAELLRRATLQFDVQSRAETALRSGSRMLKLEETLAEAGVSAGGLVEVCEGNSGGMPVGFEGQRAIDNLRLQVLELEKRLECLSACTTASKQGGISWVVGEGGGMSNSIHAKAQEGEYVRIVIECLNESKESKIDTDGRKKAEEQIKALEDVARAIKTRLQSVGPTDGIVFNAGVDDDEILLGLMSEIDTGDTRNGSVSKEELLGSKFLKEDQNREIARVFRSIFEVDLSALSDALAHLEEDDFADYRRPQAAAERDTMQDFNREASVCAVFDAAVNLMTSNTGSGLPAMTSQVCRGASKASLEQLATSFKCSSNLVLALKRLANTLLVDSSELDFVAIKQAARRLPRVAGPRMEWVGSMNLNAMLARHLPPGTLSDGLAGVRAMSREEGQKALEAFFTEAKVKFLENLDEVKEAKGSRSAVEANSKFQGFQGSFANLKEFHAGAEATLKLGYPNPKVMRGIMLEHSKHPSVTRFFFTTNYFISTSLLIEYWWGMYDKYPAKRPCESPTSSEIEDIRVRAISELRAIREARGEQTEGKELFFPGELGDSFVESFVIIRLTSSEVNSVDPETKKSFADMMAKEANKVLETGEECARGVTLVDVEGCITWMAKNSSILSHQAAALDLQPKWLGQEVLVGFVVPMSITRAEKFIGFFTGTFQSRKNESSSLVRFSYAASVASCKKIMFSSYLSIEDLRKALSDKSIADLQEELKQRGSSYSSFVNRQSLSNQLVYQFVVEDLQADFRMALNIAYGCKTREEDLDSKLILLLREWGIYDSCVGMSRETRIDLAVQALNSAERWDMIKDWVRLYCGRIHGRKRLGLMQLKANKRDEIERCKLQDGEVLALYTYTGRLISHFISLYHRILGL